MFPALLIVRFFLLISSNLTEKLNFTDYLYYVTNWNGHDLYGVLGDGLPPLQNTYMSKKWVFPIFICSYKPVMPDWQPYLVDNVMYEWF